MSLKKRLEINQLKKLQMFCVCYILIIPTYEYLFVV